MAQNSSALGGIACEIFGNGSESEHFRNKESTDSRKFLVKNRQIYLNPLLFAFTLFDVLVWGECLLILRIVLFRPFQFE